VRGRKRGRNGKRREVRKKAGGTKEGMEGKINRGRSTVIMKEEKKI
jgi:DNA-binding XRE family transcriptional regulator